MSKHAELIDHMIRYEWGCPERVHHFLVVHGFSKTIGELEGLDEHTRFILEAAAIVHDIGIKPSLEKYGSASGTYQEKEGPPVARAMLEELGFDPPVTDRVCYLVGHHHTYNNIDGIDYQILIEADFLINASSKPLEQSALQKMYDSYFKTETGRRFFKNMYLNP